MKKYKFFIFTILLLFVFTNKINAITINYDVPPGTWELKDFPGDKNTLIFFSPLEKDKNYQFDQIFAGNISSDPDSYKEIMRLYIKHPTEKFKLQYDDEIVHSFTASDGKNHEFIAGGMIKIEGVIKFNRFSWQELVESNKKAYETQEDFSFEETTILGYPAYIATYKRFLYDERKTINILLEDKYVLEPLIFTIEMKTEVFNKKAGYGEDWSKHAEQHNQNIITLWERMLNHEIKMIEEISNFDVYVKREELYNGPYGDEAIELELKEEEEIKKEQKKQQIKTIASEEKGEVSITIPSVIIVAILSAFASSTNLKDNDNEKKKKTRLKMYLTKDFKDAIKVGASPVSVYARIVEINENGTEIDRPDLTKLIKIKSNKYLEVEKNQIVDNYMGALVYAPDKNVINKANILFEFSNEDGSFTNIVEFNIIDKPYIEFPEKFDYVTMTLNLILGDNEIYETPFIPRDFFDEPTKVTVKASEGAPFEVEYEKVNEDKYILRVTNKSIKANRVLLNSINGHINITMENELEKAEDTVNILILPEGLSISKVDIEDDKMQVQTFNDKGELQPVRFHVNLVVKENEKVLNLKPNKFEPIFKQIKGTSKSTDNLVTKFNYDIEPLQSNFKSYNFIPYDALIEDKNDPYIIILPINCEYNLENYTLEVPIKLLGGDSGPMEARNKELDKMRDIVRKLGLSPKTARFIRENIDTLSAKEIRLINRQICQEARDYFSKDAEELQKIANKLENLEYWFDWIKWLGDQAFSYLMTIYAGSGEIILTPAKEMAVEFIAELYADYVDGQPIDANRLSKGLENLQVISKIDGMLEDFIMDVATGKDISVKKAGTCLAGWFMYKVAKNVQDNIEKTGNYEIFDAILGAGSDLTAKALKKLGMQQFEKLITNSSFGEKFGKWFESFAGEHLKNNYKLFYDENNLLQIEDIITKSEILKKLMDGLMGEGIKWAFSKFKGEPLKDAGKQVQSYERISLTHDYKIKIILITPNEKTGEGYVAELDIINSIEGLFNLFFENVFGFIPFETKKVEPPNDPTLY